MMTESYTPPPLPSLFQNTNPPPALLTQGAEAHLYKTIYLTPLIPAALKIRPSKPYRHPTLDRRLTRQRVLQEARCLTKLVREGVSVPAVLAMDWETQSTVASTPPSTNASSGGAGAWILMEWIDGLVIRVILERWERYLRLRARSNSNSGSGARAGIDENEEKKIRGLMRGIGFAVGGLHKAGVIHGDLTTSNLILRPLSSESSSTITSVDEDGEGSPPMEGEVVLIDFGLANQSVQDEDRAVDLYVLERAFGSSHPHTEPFFDELLKGYRESHRGAVSALKRLEDVRMRGRKRSMIG